MMNLKESRECVLKPVKKKITTQWEKPKERIYKDSRMLEFPNGQIPSKLKDKEKKRKESKSLKMMKFKEDKWMQPKKPTNKSLDKVSLIRLTNNFMITKIW